MNKRWKRYFAGMTGLLLASSVSSGSLVGIQTVLADEEEQTLVNGGIENVYEAEKVFVGESISIEEEPELFIGEGTLTEESDRYEYEFKPTLDGRYYAQLTDVDTNCYATCGFYDELDNKVVELWGEGGQSKMVKLQSNQTYKVIVKRYQKDNTPFKVSIKQQKPTTDISNITEIHDQLMFADQRNYYSMIAPKTGKYRFEFTETTSNQDMLLWIWDTEDPSSYMVEETFGTRGNSLQMEEGHEYIISAGKKKGKAEYTLKMYIPKNEVDISGYTEIKDSMECKKQKNIYTFTAPVSGKYYFSFEKRDGMSVEVYIESINFPNNNVWEKYNDGRAILEEGEKYRIYITQYDGIGSYSMLVTYPDEAVEILKSFPSTINQESNTANGETGINNDAEMDALQKENEQVKAENEALQSQVDDLQSKYDQIMEMLAAQGMELE